MSIFTGLLRSRDKPQNRTAGSSYSFFMGNSTAGKPVTERSAMQMTAVYSHLALAMDDIKLGRVQPADDAFADILGELESLDV